MEKFILMYCQDREMSCHGVFDTYDSAFAAMKKEFYDFHREDKKMSDLEIVEAIGEGGVCDISEMSAWTNLGRVDMDWQIAKVEIPTEASAKEES